MREYRLFRCRGEVPRLWENVWCPASGLVVAKGGVACYSSGRSTTAIGVRSRGNSRGSSHGLAMDWGCWWSDWTVRQVVRAIGNGSRSSSNYYRDAQLWGGGRKMENDLLCSFFFFCEWLRMIILFNFWHIYAKFVLVKMTFC